MKETTTWTVDENSRNTIVRIAPKIQRYINSFKEKNPTIKNIRISIEMDGTLTKYSVIGFSKEEVTEKVNIIDNVISQKTKKGKTHE